MIVYLLLLALHLRDSVGGPSIADFASYFVAVVHIATFVAVLFDVVAWQTTLRYSYLPSYDQDPSDILCYVHPCFQHLAL